MLDEEPDLPGELAAQQFDAHGLAALRRVVAQAAAKVGLTGGRLDDVVMAVNEIATNAVAHAGGWGALRIWTRHGRLLCEVTDRGSGLDTERVYGRPPPPAAATSGRGLWLARQVASVTVDSGPSGTTIRLAFPLPG
jgi:anti-sigma regulatory factor (Ser/Thr protein kinase)